MAIYHCSLKVFSRSAGQSAVAAAAYRSGSVLYDERYDKIHSYERRKGIIKTFILLPKNTAPAFALEQGAGVSAGADRELLWNAAEASETRKNSCVARELVLALPHELSDLERMILTQDMASWLVERYSVAVDSAIHAPVNGDDARNHHAHLLYTTREVTSDGLGAKTRILDDKKTGKEETETIRAVWETLANDALRRAGHGDKRIDRRSLEEQGGERIPEVHEGSSAEAHDEALKSDHSHDDDKSQLSTQDETLQAGDSDSEEEEGDDEGKSTQGDSGGDNGGQSEANSLKNTETDTDLSEGKNRKIDYEAIDQGQSRVAFNQSVRELNAKRAVFGDVPIIDQIAALDLLNRNLDRRFARLKVLEEGTALPHMLARQIERLGYVATAIHLQTLRSDEVLKSALKEKQARIDRQLEKYGRSYRRGVKAQMNEMHEQLTILTQKKASYLRYQAFIDHIDQGLKQYAVRKILKEPDHFKASAGAFLKLRFKVDALTYQLGQVRNNYQKNKDNKGFNKRYGKSQYIKNRIVSKMQKPIEDSKVVSFIKVSSSKVEGFVIPQKLHSFYKGRSVRSRFSGGKGLHSRYSERSVWFIKSSAKVRPLTNRLTVTLKQTHRIKGYNSDDTSQAVADSKNPKLNKDVFVDYPSYKAVLTKEADTKRDLMPTQYKDQPKTVSRPLPLTEDKYIIRSVKEGLETESSALKGSLKGKSENASQAPIKAKARKSRSSMFNAASGASSKTTKAKASSNQPKLEI